MLGAMIIGLMDVDLDWFSLLKGFQLRRQFSCSYNLLDDPLELCYFLSKDEGVKVKTQSMK